MVEVRRALGVVALACALAMTGCTSDAPATLTPSPTPAVQTPTETAQERQERLDYAAAEKSYRTFRAEYNRVLRAGGAKEPTKVMKATAGGDYLDTFSTAARGFKSLRSRTTGKEEVIYVRGGGYSPKSVVLDVCEDSRSLRIIRKSGRDSRGEILKVSITVRRLDGVWKLWGGDGKAVSSCD